jgi:hypothetical protein
MPSSASSSETQADAFLLPSNQKPLGDSPTPISSSSNDFISHDIYTNQSAYYAIVMQKYGLPLDSRHLYAKSDWEFEAAAVAEPAVRKEILDRVSRWVNETATDRPLTDLYDTEGNGGFPGLTFTARPVVGAHFSFLALGRADLVEGYGWLYIPRHMTTHITARCTLINWGEDSIPHLEFQKNWHGNRRHSLGCI